MAKRRNPTHWSKPHQVKKRRQKRYVLEEGSIGGMIAERERTQSLLKFYWDFYSELAYQRKQIEPEIIAALNQNCVSNFSFKNWQRGVKYKYSLHPLSTVGSLSDPGGRFNIGDIDAQNMPQFPALYIAADKDTALQETLGQPDTGTKEISALERALTNPQSETYVSVSGNVERIFDLRNKKSLSGVVDLMKNFTFSDALCERAIELV